MEKPSSCPQPSPGCYVVTARMRCSDRDCEQDTPSGSDGVNVNGHESASIRDPHLEQSSARAGRPQELHGYACMAAGYLSRPGRG